MLFTPGAQMYIILKAAGEVAGTASLVSTCSVYSYRDQSRGRQLVLVGSNPAGVLVEP
jgi:hypothetical protein